VLLELDERRAGPDRVAFAGVELLDLAHDVRRDAHLLLRIDRAGRLDHLDDLAPLRLLDVDLRTLLAPVRAQAERQDAAEHGDDDETDEGSLHGRGPLSPT